MGKRYTEQEIERGLMALAYCSGNSRRAATLLEERGFPIPQGTLGNWTNQHAERYAKARDEILPRLNAELAEEHHGMARTGIRLAQKFYDKTEKALEAGEIPARDLPGGLRNVAVTAAIGTDKANVLRGQPTEIIGRRNADELKRALEAHGIVLDLPPEAVSEVTEPAALPAGQSENGNQRNSDA